MAFESEARNIIDQWIAKASIDVNQQAAPLDLSTLSIDLATAIEAAVDRERESIFDLICPLCAEGNIPLRLQGQSAWGFPWVHTLKEPVDGRTLEQCKAARLREWTQLPNHSARKLAELISRISQRVFHQIWMNDVEFNLWTVLDHLSNPTSLPGIKRYFGFESISEDELSTLKQLSDQAGGWVYWDVDEREYKFTSLDEWKAIHERQYDRYKVGSTFDEILETVPEEEIEQLPEDASEQLDSYIYGTSKKTR